jgi:hypothetical protein
VRSRGDIDEATRSISREKERPAEVPLTLFTTQGAGWEPVDAIPFGNLSPQSASDHEGDACLRGVWLLDVTLVAIGPPEKPTFARSST